MVDKVLGLGGGKFLTDTSPQKGVLLIWPKHVFSTEIFRWLPGAKILGQKGVVYVLNFLRNKEKLEVLGGSGGRGSEDPCDIFKNFS